MKHVYFQASWCEKYGQYMSDTHSKMSCQKKQLEHAHWKWQKRIKNRGIKLKIKNK